MFPFSSWLPFAMRAPTPTSSLVHSSTLVTAGLFLIIKFYYFINFQYLIISCLLISIITLILRGLNSLLEIDFKKIVAFSTLIQISFILLSLVINFVRFSYFHMLSHAFFKSLLFLIVGILIHRNFSQQDFRIFFKGNNILLNIMITVSLLSLIGLIFFSGFYRKDLILEKFFLIKIRFILLILIYISIIMSFFYSFLLILNQRFFSNKVILYFSSFSYFQILPFFLFLIRIMFRKFFY
jgi:NADH-ubiquinone oxidoreductase chain 5